MFGIEKHVIAFLASGITAFGGLASGEIAFALGGLLLIGALGGGLAVRLSVQR